MNVFAKAYESYKGREYLYLFPQVESGYWAVNYYAICSELNSLLALFSTSGKRTGKSKLSEDNNHSEVWFEVSDDFYNLATTNQTFKTAIERLGVKIVTDYPFFEKSPLAQEWEAHAKAVQDLRDRWQFFEED